MDSDNFLLAVAVVAVVVAVVGLSVSYNSISTFQNILTGFATENGSVNITIEENVAINITRAGDDSFYKMLFWGDGFVDSGQDYSFLCTNGTVLDGSWDPIEYGFNVRNIGNVNLTLNVSSNYNADDFIGGTGPSFMYNFSSNESGSCTSWATSVEGEYIEFTTSPVSVCENFLPLQGSSTLRMDVCLVVPKEAVGAKTNTVVLTYDKA